MGATGPPFSPLVTGIPAYAHGPVYPGSVTLLLLPGYWQVAPLFRLFPRLRTASRHRDAPLFSTDRSRNAV